MRAAHPSRREASASSSGGSDVRPAPVAAGLVAVSDRELGGGAPVEHGHQWPRRSLGGRDGPVCLDIR